MANKSDPWIICPACEGDGSHVNPNIDAGGIPAQQFAEDPQFAEEYFGGLYDVACQVCNQSGKIRQSQVEQLEEAAQDRNMRMHESGQYDPGITDYRYGF